MIRPITLYGNPVLRQKGERLTPDYPQLPQLIDDMFETMYNAQGVGLAAPQIGLAILLFVVDTAPMAKQVENPEEQKFLKNFKRAFINPEIISEEGLAWPYEEGCLSIPGIRENVNRQPDIRVRYQDLQWNTHEETLTGLAARVFQHEYDHVNGVLFVDHLSGLRKQLVRPKLSRISKKGAEPGYPVVLNA